MIHRSSPVASQMIPPNTDALGAQVAAALAVVRNSNTAADVIASAVAIRNALTRDQPQTLPLLRDHGVLHCLEAARARHGRNAAVMRHLDAIQRVYVLAGVALPEAQAAAIPAPVQPSAALASPKRPASPQVESPRKLVCTMPESEPMEIESAPRLPNTWTGICESLTACNDPYALLLLCSHVRLHLEENGRTLPLGLLLQNLAAAVSQHRSSPLVVSTVSEIMNRVICLFIADEALLTALMPLQEQVSQIRSSLTGHQSNGELEKLWDLIDCLIVA